MSSQESILTCLLFFWLFLKLYQFCYITLYYSILLNCIIVDYFIFLCDYYLVLFLLFSFYFHFIFLLVLLSICSCVAFVVLSRICVIVFIIILYHYVSRVIPWARNVGKRPTVSLFFSSRHIWKHVLNFFFFFEGACFKFY